VTDFGSINVQIKYANLAKMNKVRAWARKNNATVHVSRYARDAYEGHVTIHSPWDEGASVTGAKAVALRALIEQAGAVQS